MSSYQGAIIGSQKARAKEHAVNRSNTSLTLCKKPVRKSQLLDDRREWDRDGGNACQVCIDRADAVDVGF